MTQSLRLSSRDAIIEAGFTVFNRDPSASLSQVADLAGVGRATLHRHFSSREILVGALARIALQEMDDVVGAACTNVRSYGEAMRVSLEVLIPLGDRHGFLASDIVEHDPDLRQDFARMQRETQELASAAKSEGVFDKSVPTSWIVQAFDHLLYAAWESVKANEATPEQAANLAWRTLTSGLGRTV